jgi:hypothetical protein
MTNTELKSAIDQGITNKTLPSTITPSNVGTNMKSIVDYVDQEIEANPGTTGATGATGAQGPTGPQGVPGPVGPAGLNWQGEWDSDTTYEVNDAVGYDGASWFCISPVTSGTGNDEPDTATLNWALLASQGAIGPQGPQGIQGPAGTGTSIVKEVKVTLSSSQILNIFTNPIELVPAQAGKILIPQFVHQKFIYGTVTYVGGALLKLRIGTNLSNPVQNLAQIINSTNNAQSIQNLFYNNYVGGDLNLQGLSIVLEGSNPNPTLGDGTMDVYLTYLEITL